VAAGVRQQLDADARRYDNLLLIEQPFMVIRQATGVARARGPVASRYLDQFIDELKTSGEIGALIARHGIAGVSVAPAKTRLDEKPSRDGARVEPAEKHSAVTISTSMLVADMLLGILICIRNEPLKTLFGADLFYLRLKPMEKGVT